MLSRVLFAPSRALRHQTESLRSFHSCSIRFDSLPTKDMPTATMSRGEFVRPRVADQAMVSRVETPIARPKVPEAVKEYGFEQAPNRYETWSESQRPKSEAMRGPRFEQMDPSSQPQSLSAMELINNYPIQFTQERVTSCDGGDGPLGHPRVFINLDKPEPKPCPYCGIRYQKTDHDHH